jgi:hypothetical protein
MSIAMQPVQDSAGYPSDARATQSIVALRRDVALPRIIAGVSTPLLPEPGAGGLSGTQDALAMMYDLVAKQGEMTLALGQMSASNAQRQQLTELSQERAAEQQEQQAEANQGGFWSDLLGVFEDIGKVVGLVAAAAATVCSFGTAGVAATAVAAVLISTGFVVSETHCLGKDSGIVGFACEIGGAVVTMGMTSGAVASNAVSSAAKAVNVAATAASGVCDVGAGIATCEEGKFESECEDAAADVQQALNRIQQDGRLISDVISGLKNAQESNNSALQIVAAAAQTYGQTSVAAASPVGSGGIPLA